MNLSSYNWYEISVKTNNAKCLAQVTWYSEIIIIQY